MSKNIKSLNNNTLDIKEPINNNNLYSEIENLIIAWSIDETKTAGFLTRQIMELLNLK